MVRCNKIAEEKSKCHEGVLRKINSKRMKEFGPTFLVFLIYQRYNSFYLQHSAVHQLRKKLCQW